MWGPDVGIPPGGLRKRLDRVLGGFESPSLLESLFQAGCSYMVALDLSRDCAVELPVPTIKKA